MTKAEEILMRARAKIDANKKAENERERERENEKAKVMDWAMKVAQNAMNFGR